MQKGIIITNLIEHNIVQYPVNITDHNKKVVVMDTTQILGQMSDNTLIEVNCN